MSIDPVLFGLDRSVCEEESVSDESNGVSYEYNASG